MSNPVAGNAAPNQPTAPSPQAGAPAQGTSQGDGFRQTFFPNVPDEHWGLIEPHIQNVNKHVTELQQRYAPFKGYTPEAVQGLAQFSDAFEQDPMGQWINLARVLQQRGIIDPDLDLEDLAAIAPPGAQRQESPNGGISDPADGELPSAVQQLLDQQQAKIAELEGRLDKGEQTQRSRQEDIALSKQLTYMREQLREGGIDEALLTDSRLLSAFITHQGNADAAVKDQLDYRSGILKGLVPDPTKQRQQQELDLPNGTPNTPKDRQNASARGRRGMFRDVSASAEQALARANQE